MPRDDSHDLRHRIDLAMYQDEAAAVQALVTAAGLSTSDRKRISARGADLVRQIRASSEPGLMEVFLAEYGLSTDEGIALMCLAEALLRVPDAETMDDLGQASGAFCLFPCQCLDLGIVADRPRAG